MSLSSISKAARWSLSAIALCATAACGTKDAAAPLQPSGPTGRIRFVNVITDTTRGRVNAILEGVPFGVNMTYTTSTPATLATPSTANYAAILTGSRSLVLKRTADTNVVVATIPVTIGDGEDRTVYAVGGTAGGTVTSFSTTDDNTTAIPAGQTSVRVVNLSPAAGAVDVFVTAPNADLATATPVATNVAPSAASVYANIAPLSTYQIRAVPAGTAAANRAANVLVSVTPTVPASLSAGTGHTIIIADKAAGGAPSTAFVLTDR